MATIIAIQLKHKEYESANPIINSSGTDTGAEFHEYLYGFPEGDPTPLNYRLKFTITEIRNDSIGGLDPHTIVFEWDNTNLIFSTTNNIAPFGDPISVNARLIQHDDTGDLEGAATFAFEVPELRDGPLVGGNVYIEDSNGNVQLVLSPNPSALTSFNGLFPPPASNEIGKLRLKIERMVINDDGSAGGFEIISNQTIVYAKLNVDASGDVFTDFLPVPLIHLQEAGTVTDLNIGAGNNLPVSSIDAKKLTFALLDDYVLPFYDVDEDPPAEVCLLSAQTMENLSTLFSGGSIGFSGMSDFISSYTDLSDPGNINCEEVAIAMIADMVSSGMPLPGFPDGLGPLPPPPVPSLIPPKLDKIVKGVTDALDAAAMAVGAPASIPQLIEKITRDICEIVSSIVAVAQLQSAKNICFNFPLRPDLLGVTSDATPNKDVKVILCADTFNIGEVLTAINAELVHALTADSPEEFSLSDRIEQIVLMDETQIGKQLDKAIADGKIGALSPLEKAKVVRQLGALVANPANTPKCKIEAGSPAHDLVKAWADYNATEDISDFWENDVKPNAAHMEGHLDLVLCFITKGHEALITEVKDYLTAQGLALDVSSIAPFSRGLWTSFFFPCIPLCVPGINIESRINRLLQNAAVVRAKHQSTPYATLADLITDLTGSTDVTFIADFDAALNDHFGAAPTVDQVAAMTSGAWRSFFTATCVNDAILPEGISPSMAEDRFAAFCDRLNEVIDAHAISPLTLPQALDALTVNDSGSLVHQPLIDAINTAFAPANTAALLAISKSDWRDLFFPPDRFDLLPDFTDTTADADRILLFIAHAQTISQQITDGTLTTINDALNALVIDPGEPVRSDVDTWLSSFVPGTYPNELTALENVTAADWNTFFGDPLLFVSGVFPVFTSISSKEDRVITFIERYEEVKLATDPGGILNGLPYNPDVLKALTSPYTTTGDLDPAGVGLPALEAEIDPALAANLGDFLIITPNQWLDLFCPATRLDLFPPYTRPSNMADLVERVLACIGQCFPLPPEDCPIPDPVIPVPASFDCLVDNCLTDIADNYPGGLIFGSIVEADLDTALDIVHGPGPSDEKECCKKAFLMIDELFQITSIVLVPPLSPAMQFSLMEALYAKGFTSAADVTVTDANGFKEALTGTAAYDHFLAIWNLANAIAPHIAIVMAPSSFVPINSDGALRNCIPPSHASECGPVSYLFELLNVDESADCANPLPPSPANPLGGFVANRRGDIGGLLTATRNNVELPVPLVDIINESLEHMVANNTTSGTIQNTSETAVKGLSFEDHDPVKLLCAIPEHSAPTITAVNTIAYDKLKDTFTAPELPYHLIQDVSECYLGEFGLNLFDLKRRFRKDITEFALAPAPDTDPVPNEPLDFKTHLWRYPVRFEIALEYLGISAEEYTFLFQTNLTGPRSRNLYGYLASFGPGWRADVRELPNFLERTCLTYEQFLELWKSNFVTFENSGPGSPDFPEQAPHDLSVYVIDFPGGGIGGKLKKLAVFIRLWRKLQEVDNAQYSFEALKDIAEVLVLFNGNNINPDFIRQLAAFQMLRDDFALALKNENVSPAGTGADRLHILALWAGPAHPQWDWVVDHLLAQIKLHCEKHYRCKSRPDVVKLLKSNLDGLSRLANFDPDDPAYTWFNRPAHTLRFAEVLCKIYTSDFDVEELFYLFTAEQNLGGEDPFLLQSPNEVEKCPFDLPECSDFPLSKLRDQLLAVNFTSVGTQQWDKCNWKEIQKILKEKFCYLFEPADEDPLVSVCLHFFPGKSDDCDCSDDGSDPRTWYCVDLANTDTSEDMWDEPPGSPFFYDEANEQLCFALPLSNKEVIEKIYTDKLNAAEKTAVRDLFFKPRKELAQIGFLFSNQQAAIEYLIQEPDAEKRWTFFQKSFAVFYERSRLIATFLSEHVSSVDSAGSFEGGVEVMWEILKNLYADENRSTGPQEWEQDGGAVPDVLWNPLPQGGAFAAINGLTGTGLLGAYYLLDDGALNYDSDGRITNTLLWREVRGPMDAFGTIQNQTNAPVPTIMPALEWEDTSRQLVTICNGFALENSNGDLLGGALAYGVRWTGVLLIDQKGKYTFHAGMPASEGEAPLYDEHSPHRWKMTLKRGQKTIEVLSKGHGEEHIPCDCSIEIGLLPCAYEITIDYIYPSPDFDREEEICPLNTGFQLKYIGPDTKGKLAVVPFHKLFRDCKDGLLSEGVPDASTTNTEIAIVEGEALAFLESYYTSTIRDIRRTYQRAFKAGLFARRFALSAEKTTRNQSELSYLIAHPADFEGSSYYLDAGDFVSHKAHFNFNFLPVNDIYKSATYDDRNTPSVKRQQALFDWWERLFDYKQLERSVSGRTRHPLWELFLYEADENNLLLQPESNRIERYLATNLKFTNINAVLAYAPATLLTHENLFNEEWGIRIYQAAKAVRMMAANLTAEKGPLDLAPAAWADGSDLDKLAAFLCQSLIEDCNPPQYKALEEINNKLRLKARNALVAYLTSHNRVELPWQYDTIAPTPVFAMEAKHLSELLLLDVEAGLCEKASRVEESITAVQTYVHRVRLGLEYPASSTPVPFNASLDFIHLWDKHFATFYIWKKCKMQEIYKENWVEYDLLEAARKTEAFRHLEDRLRRQTLTVPFTNGIPNPTPANNIGGLLLQDKEPAITQKLPAAPHSVDGSRSGFSQLGTPEVHGRPSWLTALVETDLTISPPKVPYWIEAAIRLGKKFVRVAAAGQPLNRLYCPPVDGDCCETCHSPHEAHVDEYYFWLVDSNFFRAIPQSADWEWHSEADLPALLSWTAENKVLLAWTKIHNGEFQQLRFSDEGIHVVDSNSAEIEFMGRTLDTLRFKVIGGITPVGYPNEPEPGFRYDMVPDAAVALPQLSDPLSGAPDFGGLSAFPTFAYFVPGATVLPPSLFSPAIAIANNLRTHCRFEMALKAYEQVYNPLMRDNTWGDLIEQDKAILLHYLETLLQWGDALMKQHSPEAFQQARLVYDTACKILGTCPVSVTEGNNTALPVGNFTPPVSTLVNPRLLNLFENIEDRLDLIRSCQNAYRYKNGKPDKDMPYFGDGWQTNMDICMDELESCLPQSPYRFQFLLQKAQEFAGEVASLGGALLSAYEKGDGEYLASLRGYHEKQLLELALEIRKDQWRASDWDVQGLYKAKEMAQIRLAYNQELYDGGLNGGESDYVSYTQVSLTELIISKTIEIGAQILRGIPDVLAGMPQMHLPLGSKMAGFVSTISQVFSIMSQYHGTYAGLRNTEGGWERREREWLHQIELITVEIQQIERQILASERRRDVALQELNNQVQQIENSRAVFDFMKDKFSNHELYLWMQKETAALHHQMYELSLLLARQAERAFNYERGFSTRKFIDGNMIWDNLHEGLLAGERLQHALRQMEKTYYNENVREYELTKNISLRHHFPLEFLMLKETGCCIIQLPEWMFDKDYPGHYMRRIKNVTLSIPCVVGPYTGVHCRLTLLSSRTRIKPHLNKCLDDNCTEGLNNGYPAMPDDPRMVHQFISSEAIATSNGQQDSGMFDLNFNDDRYLPFEYAGAVSCWRIELPKENNFFDMDSLGDVIMQLNYMAREGGELLRQAANEIAGDYLPGNGKRLLDVRHELAESWHNFQQGDPEKEHRELSLKINRNMIPYLPCDEEVAVDCMEMILELPGEFKEEQFEVSFIPDLETCKVLKSKGKSAGITIHCIAASDWKEDCDKTRLYQGKIDVKEAKILLNDKKQELGRLLLPARLKEIRNFYLILNYKKRREVVS